MFDIIGSEIHMAIGVLPVSDSAAHLLSADTGNVVLVLPPDVTLPNPPKVNVLPPDMPPPNPPKLNSLPTDTPPPNPPKLNSLPDDGKIPPPPTSVVDSYAHLLANLADTSNHATILPGDAMPPNPPPPK